jgi:hypothetical protein
MKRLKPISTESESLAAWNVEVRTQTASAEASQAPMFNGSVQEKTPSSYWSLIIGAKKSIFCTANSRNHADQIIHRLKMAGIPSSDLSALFPDNEITYGCQHEKGTPKRRGEQPGVLARTAWWAARRVGFATIGALAIPGVGSFIAAGPIIAALSGAAVSAAGGGIAGGLIGMGIPEVEARRYEAKIKHGEILISVHTENSGEIDQAKLIFQETGAQNIWAMGEASMMDSLASECASRPGESACRDTPS